MSIAKTAAAGCVTVLLLAACSEPAPGGAGQAQTGQATPASQTAQAAQPVPPVDVQPAPLEVPPVTASASPLAGPIDQASWSETAVKADAKRNLLIKAEVLLSRAHFSPGVIDGQDGGNLKNAISAFEASHGLAVDGKLDAEVWKLLAPDAAPVVTDYTITAEDVAGPFVAKIPKDYGEMAKLERLAYTTPLEALGEKFHMDEALLKTLNPGVDFGVAGTTILVIAPGPEALPAKVTMVEVDKAKGQLRAFGADGKLMAAYPATVGSSDRPAPSGEWAVKGVAKDPVWSYDPKRLTFGEPSKGKFTIQAGPNNPVGAVWIDLTKDTYGIHGAPDPRLVGKVASHGCVRLTNWDAKQLASAVKPGTKVVFAGDATPRPAKV